MHRQVILDVETKNLFRDIESENPEKLGVSIVSLYIRDVDDSQNELQGKILSIWEKEIDQLWPILQKADRIIGFNTLHFDMQVLQPYTPEKLSDYPHLDILDHVKRRIGKRLPLTIFARDTLGEEKNDIGTNAVRYYRLGDRDSLNKLKTYCEHDVDITKKLYDFGIRNGYLQYKDKWNNLSKVEVDFSYNSLQKEVTAQIELL